MSVCPNCRLWELARSDVFCSWCAFRLVSLRAELGQKRFSTAELPPPLDLVLSNQSDTIPITIQAVEPSAAWIRVDNRLKKPPFALPTNESVALTVQIRTVDLTEAYHAGFVLVRSNLGEEKIPVEVIPPPRLSISAYSGSQHRDSCRFEVLLDNRNLERNLVRVGAEQGVVVIESIATDQPAWAAIRFQGECPMPIVLDARKSAYIDVYLEVDEAQLAQKNPQLPAEHTANLLIQCEEFTHSEPLAFECWLPPALWIWQEAAYAIDAWAGQPGEILLTLQNSLPGNPMTGKGNAPLQVTRIEIEEAGGEPCSWLKPVDEPSNVVEIRGGAHRDIRFAFETDAAEKGAGDRLGLGRHPVILVLTTNLPEVTRKLRFEVNVQRIRDFDGILAIDFGTSNTCCAVFGGAEQRYSLIPVDRRIHNETPTTTPTLVQYLDPPAAGPANIRIGAEIDALSLSVKVIRSTARSPKRRLGAGKPFEICFYNSPEVVVNYPAKQVVCDYLREVRRAAERQHRGFRFRNIVITHPSRFKLDQLMDLEEAVRGAFGADCDISLLPEPVAAALGFIVEKEALSKDRYSVGVFDFGGGTTDLSLMEVVNRSANGYVEVYPRQLNSTGRWFGGEDVTRFIYEQGLQGCKRIAAADHPNEALFVEAEKLADGNQRQVAIENHGRLLQWAEESKLLLIEYGDNHNTHFRAKPDLFPDLKLSLWTNSGPEQRLFAHDQIVPKRAEMDAFLRPHLEELAADLAELVSISGVGSLDYIRLSGKPSAMPLVGEVLAERFPDAQRRPAREPKECVVEGACIPDQYRASTRVVLILGDSDFVRTTSRIGVEDASARKFVEMIGVGVPISEGGLTGFYENFPLRQGVKVRLLDNASISNDSLLANADITVIGTFVLDPSQTALPRNQVVPARLELRLSKEFKPTLLAHVPNGEPVQFVVAGPLAAQGGN